MRVGVGVRLRVRVSFIRSFVKMRVSIGVTIKISIRIGVTIKIRVSIGVTINGLGRTQGLQLGSRIRFGLRIGLLFSRHFTIR